MKTFVIISTALLSILSLEASSINQLNDQEKNVYTIAQEKGQSVTNTAHSYLDTKENCNVAYDRLELTSIEQSNIDVFIKGFFEACTKPKA